jgi:hypothetical protein
MKPIERSITFLESETVREASLEEVRKGEGLYVRSYAELVEHVAELSFNNPEYLLFFRGQSVDYRIDSLTTIHTALFRSYKPDGRLNTLEIKNRFSLLENAEEAIAERFNLPEKFNQTVRERIQKYSILRWALLQHYGVCLTPLLDITHSLRVACSFAFQEGGGEPFIFVLGLPQISGSITTSSEHGIQVLRLLSICPPIALRPHYQEGYLVGEFPTISFQQKAHYDRAELDMANRLVCKFRLAKHEKFWSSSFGEIPREALFPDDRDQVKIAMDRIKRNMGL